MKISITEAILLLSTLTSYKKTTLRLMLTMQCKSGMFGSVKQGNKYMLNRISVVKYYTKQ